MKPDIRIFEFANGRMVFQQYVPHISGFDEDGVPHYSGQGEWMEIPHYRWGEWDYDKDRKMIPYKEYPEAKGGGK